MREIICSESFVKDAEKLGGMKIIDKAMEPIINALYENPYGFNSVENDWIKIRYAVTRKIVDCPPLIVEFEIDNKKNVLLRHVEEFDAY